MASITDKLFETENQLQGMVEASGKVVPTPGERTDIVSHLDYIIKLLGTMVTEETYDAAKQLMAAGYNGIQDRVEAINWMLSSGEISGDIDIEPLTVTENGEYMPGAGKAFGRVVVSTPEAEEFDMQINFTSDFSIYTSEYTSVYKAIVTSVNSPACTSIGSSAFTACFSLASVNFPACTSIGSSAFAACSSLTEVSFPACTSIGNYAFSSCYNLISLFLTGSTMCELGGSSAFASTPIGGYSASAGRYGSIFVPASLVDQYKAAPNWSYVSDRITAYVEP